MQDLGLQSCRWHLHSSIDEMLRSLNKRVQPTGSLHSLKRESRVPRSVCKYNLLWKPATATTIKHRAYLCRLAKVRELSLERNHGIAIIMNCNVIQQRNGSWDLISAQESKDSQLSKTTVVQLSSKALLLRFGGHVLVESKWIIEVCDMCWKENWMRNGDMWERIKFTWNREKIKMLVGRNHCSVGVVLTQT